ncbi:intraflagellar transport protein 46 homolog [Halyomorpha halys]|uniref:intraflagellar transport protein 46 homolog n=1 Tax=Halyomorpha halys TaxID=286706 RepID=UPI0006D4E272|nr:intraflagellar transport protein 46 homolog [Halyomorpha halys]
MNELYDEEIDVKNADEVDSLSPRSPRREYVSSRMEMRAEMKPKRERPMSAAKSRSSSRIQPVEIPSGFEHGDTESSENSEEDDDDDEGGDPHEVIIEGAYDPKDYQRLPVSADIKELFEYITFYTPVTVQLDYKLIPFIPSYIPAVGDIDAFIKVRRPDDVDDNLGLTVVDEPSIHQSEPAVMHLQLRATTKQSSAKPVLVKKLANAEKNPKAIDKWIKDISELHKSKPPPTLEYSRPMPDIDGLMQEWPPEFENKLNEIGLPLEDLDVDILTYADIICAIFDIPRYESRIESLHILFTLYSAIKNYKSNSEGNAVLENQDN